MFTPRMIQNYQPPKFKVIKRNRKTGVVQRYSCCGMEFDWVDWIICNVSWAPDNVIHRAIATSFKIERGNLGNLVVMEPTYEMSLPQNYRDLWYFQPVKVIPEMRESAFDFQWNVICIEPT